MTTLAKVDVRWSTAATICPRQAVYAATRDEQPQHPEHVLRRFARGTRLGKLMGEEVAAELERKGWTVTLEHEAAWPLANPVGTGHADVYATRPSDFIDHTESRVVEIVSAADGKLPARKPIQAAGYALHRNAERADVLVVQPSTGEDTVYPVSIDGLRPTVEEIERQVVAGLAGDLPPRVESSPSSSPCLECPFARECWEGYQPPPFGRLPSDVAERAEQLAVLKAKAKESRRAEKELEDEIKVLQEELAPHFAAGVDYPVGPVILRRSRVKGRRSLDFGAMEATGHTLPDDVAQFVKESDGHDTWTLKRGAE